MDIIEFIDIVSMVSTTCHYRIAQLIIRPHLTTTRMYCRVMRHFVTDGVPGEAWSVCLSVGRSVCHNFEPCWNGWTDRDAVWDVDSCGSREPCVRLGPDPPYECAILGGNVICTANGWLKEQGQQFFYNRIRALEKRWTKCISVAGDYVEKWQNMMCIRVINCVSLRTFWTPLILLNIPVFLASVNETLQW